MVGEQAAKILALQRAQATSLGVAKPMALLLMIFRPAIISLNGLSGLVLRLIGLPPETSEEHLHSAQELKHLVSASGKAGLVGRETT